MSPDEVMVFIVSGALALILWGRWYWQTFSLELKGRGTFPHWMWRLAPLLAAAGLLFVLTRWASADVVGIYVLFYLTFGAAWGAVCSLFFGWLGVSVRDDVLERRNPAAAYATAGGLLGATACFAGGNIGNGPGWWVVLFAGGLATVAWFLCWLVLELWGRPHEAIVVDRDIAAGVRVAGLLTVAGIVMGRGAAGDWVSVKATWDEFFHIAWPMPILFAVAALLERSLRPSAEHPRPDWVLFGALPAALYALIGGGWLAFQGWWA